MHGPAMAAWGFNAGPRCKCQRRHTQRKAQYMCALGRWRPVAHSAGRSGIFLMGGVCSFIGRWEGSAVSVAGPSVFVVRRPSGFDGLQPAGQDVVASLGQGVGGDRAQILLPLLQHLGLQLVVFADRFCIPQGPPQVVG